MNQSVMSLGLPRLLRASRSPAELIASPLIGNTSKALRSCHLPSLRSVCVVLILALLPPVQVWGQVISSSDAAAQEQLREQERNRRLREQQERIPDVHLRRSVPVDATLLHSDEQPCFIISRIVLAGNTASQFEWALAAANQAGQGQIDSPIGHCVGTKSIDLIMRRVQNAILANGYVTTRVLVEAQDLSTGTLKLTVVEGRVRDIRILPGSDARATLWNAVPFSSGDRLDLRRVEQALENFKRLPTVEADIQILPAAGSDARPGESDIGIVWRQRFPLRLNLSVDDAGSPSTGKYQGSATIAYDHALTLNDLFYITFNHDLDGKSGRLGTGAGTVHYSLPYGSWLLGVTGNSSAYHQSVIGANQTYLYRGDSRNGVITLSRLFYRDATRKSTLSLGGWVRSSHNFIDDTEVEVQRRRMAGWELGLAHRELLGAASIDLRLNYRRGTGAVHAVSAPEEAFGEGTSRFGLLTADGNLTIPFSPFGLRYSGTWRIQNNRTPLTAQDRFAIGGRYTVRGFDGDTSLIAERGWLLRNDLSVALGKSGQELYVGFDHGEVSGPASNALVARRLNGAVIGLRGQFMSFQYDIFAGAPVRKPTLFRTGRTTAGFSMSSSF